jgi:hypothetical protein
LGRPIGGLWRPRQVNGDTQQASGGALDLHQVISQTANGLFNNVLQCHLSLTQSKTIAQKKRAVITRPFGREPGLYCKKVLRALICKGYSSLWPEIPAILACGAEVRDDVVRANPFLAHGHATILD